MALDLDPNDLATYLGVSTVDEIRASMILRLATNLASSVVTPLPDTADAVVLGIAARAFNNVTSAHQIGLGSGQVSYGSPNSSMGVGGLYLSKSDISTLRRLAGSSGAFTIDPTPADAGTGLPVWDQNVTYLAEVPTAEDPLL